MSSRGRDFADAQFPHELVAETPSVSARRATYTMSDPSNAWREKIETELTRRVGSVPVILAGSRAIGTANAHSDYDIAVVLPLTRIPRAVPQLAAAAKYLGSELGVNVSVNPVPSFRMRWPAGSLFVRKLRAEGVVLAAPPGWSLRREPLNSVTDFAACSVLLSAVGNLLEGFDTLSMRGERAPMLARNALRKAALHVAQVGLLRSGHYASDLESALARLGGLPSNASEGISGAPLSRALLAGLAEDDLREGFLRMRQCVVRQLADLSNTPFTLTMTKSLIRNLQYAVIASLRGRNRWRMAFRRTPVEAILAATQLELLRALDPFAAGGYNAACLNRAVKKLQILSGASLMISWEVARDIALTEWSDAHPLVGLMA